MIKLFYYLKLVHMKRVTTFRSSNKYSNTFMHICRSIKYVQVNELTINTYDCILCPIRACVITYIVKYPYQFLSI